ncbi:MAG: hypothetical protein JW395_3312 [Nitrospira sp.]|nr:hypothetical protein [Nitrospira sp.]
MPKKPAKRPPGHQSSYTVAKGNSICNRIAAGESVIQICKDYPGVSPTAVRYHWPLKNKAFATQYALATEARNYHWADETMDIADNAGNDWMQTNDPDNPGWRFNGDAVARSRLRVDTRKWFLSKLMPKVYGDKLDVEHSGNLTVKFINQGDGDD